jgi:Polyketide cyclase / dehydrase and lipid transport
MRLLKRILAGVAILVVVLVAGAYLLPREAQVTRSLDIAAAPATIFPIASDLRRFNEWSPWLELDPATSYSFTGPTDGVGQTMNWISKDPTVGSGRIAVTRIDPGRLVEMSLVFGRQGTARSWIELTPNGGTTRVTWGFGADTGFNPVARYVGLMMDRAIGPDYEKGLARLKAKAEGR